MNIQPNHGSFLAQEVNLVNDTTRRLVAEPIESCLSNHPLRPHEHVGRNRQADLLRRLEIDDQLKPHGGFNRQVSRLRAFEDFFSHGLAPCI